MFGGFDALKWRWVVYTVSWSLFLFFFFFCYIVSAHRTVRRFIDPYIYELKWSLAKFTRTTLLYTNILLVFFFFFFLIKIIDIAGLYLSRGFLYYLWSIYVIVFGKSTLFMDIFFFFFFDNTFVCLSHYVRLLY